ncbi:MAG: hypothetical protein ACRDMV_14475 [Streptosporangiales bacterium]
MRSSRVRSVLAGILVANSAPHLASAAANRQHLTPLAGRRSGPLVNGVWALANVAGAALLLRPSRRSGAKRWDADLLAFETGYLVFAAWMAGSEHVLGTNSGGRLADRAGARGVVSAWWSYWSTRH